MFTGIVQAQGIIEELHTENDTMRIGIAFPDFLLPGLINGASVSIDGVCLTVVSVKERNVFFDAIKETLKRTTLGESHMGQKVNLERSAKFGDEIGGHLLSGHILGKADLFKIEHNIFTFRFDRLLMKYLFTKGYIALDGISLTLVDVNRKEGLFTVHLIPETLKRTTLGWKKEKSKVNVEIDSLTLATVETVEAVLQTREL